MLKKQGSDSEFDLKLAEAAKAMPLVPGSVGSLWSAAAKEERVRGQRYVWVSAYYPVYSGDLKVADPAGRLGRLRIQAWRQFAFSAAQTVLSAIDVAGDSGNFRLRRIIRSPQVEKIIEALDKADAMVGSLEEVYEVRFIEFPGISVGAVWLARDEEGSFEGIDDKFVLYSRTSRGLNYLECYVAAEFWDKVERAAKKRKELEEEAKEKREAEEDALYRGSRSR